MTSNSAGGGPSLYHQIQLAIQHQPHTQLIEWFALLHSTLVSLFGTMTLLYYSKFYIKHCVYVVQHRTINHSIFYNELQNTHIIQISVILFSVVSIYYMIDLVYLTLYTPHNTIYYTYALHHIITSLGLSNAVYTYYYYSLYDIVWIFPVLAVVEYSNPPRSLADMCHTYQQSMSSTQSINHNHSVIQHNHSHNNKTTLKSRKSNKSTNAYNSLVSPKLLQPTPFDHTIEYLINIHAMLFFVIRFLITQYTVRIYYYMYESYICMGVAIGLILFSLCAGIMYLVSVDGGINGCVYVNNTKQKIDVMV